MTSFDSELPQDLTSCHQMIVQLRAERAADAERIGELEASISVHEETIEKLCDEIRLFKRSLFGQRRERYVDDDPNQGLLFESSELDQPEDNGNTTPSSEEPAKKKRTSKGRARRQFPDFLPREEERHILEEQDIPEHLRDDPHVRRFFKKVGERLEYIPPALKVIEILQEVIAADLANEETTIIAARRPPQLIQSFAGTSVLAMLTVSRFADHLPYYRLEDILGRSGFRIDRSTQWRWMQRVAEAVTPLVDLMRMLVRESLVLSVDETPVKMLSPGKTVTTYLWATAGDWMYPYDSFYFTADRSRAGPREFLSGFDGYLFADAYVGYETIGDVYPDILKVSCWAHARRKFEEVHFLGPTRRTHTAMRYIRQLYDIEDVLHDVTDEQRYEMRQVKSKPIVEQFHQWLLTELESGKVLPKSKIRSAMTYMTNRWDTFSRYLDCGRIKIDNNHTEATLKYAILGRNAWLFVGNETAGETAATLFTLTKTCNRHHIDPMAYLTDVYTRLPNMTSDELPDLLPDRWIEQHPQHRVQKRVQESIDRARRTRERRAERRAAA